MCLAFSVKAQENLVFNPDFEIYSDCPVSTSMPLDQQIERCTGWYSPSFSTSDYFNRCDTGSFVSIPYNVFGYQETKNGDGYCGFAGYMKSFPVNETPYLWIEYIQSELISPLEKDKIYHVSFFLNLTGYSTVANRIGAYFSGSPLLSDNTSHFEVEPQIYSNVFITDTMNWTEVSGYFKAKGGEKFITIGDFYLDTMSVAPSGPLARMSYYHVDGINVSHVTEEIFVIPNIFTPNNDGVNDEIDFSSMPSGLKISIINRWGNLVFETDDSVKIWKNSGELSDGTYFYVLEEIITGKIITSGFIQLTH